MPTLLIQAPASSYMPEVIMTDRTRSTGPISSTCFAAERIPAAVGEGRGHDGEVEAVHQDGALAEVVLQDRRRVILDDVEGPQQVRECRVAVAVLELGFEDLLADRELAAGEGGVRTEDPFEPGLPAGSPDQRGGGEGAGVDHRVGRTARSFGQRDLVERVPDGSTSTLRPRPRRRGPPGPARR